MVDKSGNEEGDIAMAAGATNLDNDEMDRTGVDLGTTGRLALMAKLAEGTGMAIPAATKDAIRAHSNQQALAQGASLMSAATASPSNSSGTGNLTGQNTAVVPPVSTQCFMLSNMFDLNSVEGSTWAEEIRDDVLEECAKCGGSVLHIYVDKESPQGNVYLKCSSIAAAVAAVQALHGRWFSGRLIAAAYIPLPSYHSLFPEAGKATVLLGATTRAGV